MIKISFTGNVDLSGMSFVRRGGIGIDVGVDVAGVGFDNAVGFDDAVCVGFENAIRFNPVDVGLTAARCFSLINLFKIRDFVVDVDGCDAFRRRRRRQDVVVFFSRKRL